MKRKILAFATLLIITVFTFTPALVNAEGETITSRNNVIEKESTIYAGEIFVDGVSQMNYLYSSDFSGTQIEYDDLRAALPGTFSGLIPATAPGNGGIKVSSAHQSDMNNNWTSSHYVADQYYQGSISPEDNKNLYDENAQYKAYIDNQEFENLETNKRLFSVLSTQMNPASFQMIGEVLTQTYTLDVRIEATTIIYTRTEVTTEENLQEYKIKSANGLATAIFKFNENHNFTLNIEDILTLTPTQVENDYGVPATEFENALNMIKNNVKQYGDLISVYAITIDEGTFGYSDALKLKLKLSDKMKKYNTLKFLYLDDTNNFVVADVKDVTITSETADVDLDHLSAYAIVGTNVATPNTNKTSNPQTGDNTGIYVVILGLSSLGLIGSRIYFKRKREN